MRKVAVFFGGKSCENEISILTGVFVINVLDKEKYSVLPVYVHTDGAFYTSEKMTDVQTFQNKRYASFQRILFDGGCVYAVNGAKGKMKRLCKVDVAINCCHGGLGEGGGVSALAEWCGIPFVGTGVAGSAVFMDKYLTKLIARSLSIPTVEYIRATEKDYQKRGAFLLKSVESRLKYPVVIKPAKLGSSIGITLAKNEEEARVGIEAAFTLDEQIIIEKFLPDKWDINCAACMIKDEIFVSEPERAFGAGIYSFDDKYRKRESDPVMQKGGGRCALNGDLREKIRSYTRTLYKRMNLSGVVRMDFLVSGGKAYLCEVNTVPGSLAYYLFCERIIDAKHFFGDLIEEGVAAAQKEKKKVITTGILQSARFRGK